MKTETYHLWRILGNDLPPRHSETQTEDNLKFILENESEFRDCKKIFLLNRIVDCEKEKRLKKIIHASGHTYHVLQFDKNEFLSRITMAERMHYITNVNAARNFCIGVSLRQGARVVCPMDGGMFYTDSGWGGFRILADENPEDGFFTFATWRLHVHDDVLALPLTPQFKSTYNFGDMTSYGLTELQLAVTNKADQFFDESLMYGRADKVEFLYRLGCLGLWDHWEPGLRRAAADKKSKFYGKVKMSLPGYVCRLPSGNQAADHDNQLRGAQRFQGITELLAKAGS